MPRHKLNIQRNLKKASTKREVNLDLWSLAAVPMWILPSTLLKLEAWPGLLCSFGLTWFAGAAFDKPSIRRAAFALAGVHLAYTTGTKAIQDLTGQPIWRMGGTATNTSPPPLPNTGAGTAGLSSYMTNGNTLVPENNVLQLPNGNMGEYVAREATYDADPFDFTPEDHSF